MIFSDLCSKYAVSSTWLSLAAAALFIQACNTTSSHDDHDHHDDMWGIVLTRDDHEIARHFGEQVTYTGDPALSVAAGEESFPVFVHFLTEGGEAVTPDDKEYRLAWEIGPVEGEDTDASSVLEVIHHEEDGPWSFRLKGIGPGTVQVEFVLLHGQQDPHKDYVSLPFLVQVSQDIDPT